MSFFVTYDIKVEEGNVEKYEKLYAALGKLDAVRRQESVWEVAEWSTRTAHGLCILLSAGLDPESDKLDVLQVVDSYSFPKRRTLLQPKR
ncbi:MAG TPA: hypothetical protein VLX28_28115 [Thermoanaerobaculia bacterium]|nr:hypothetical protein [Thermoanaerobaculia bacterium]